MILGKGEARISAQNLIIDPDIELGIYIIYIYIYYIYRSRYQSTVVPPHTVENFSKKAIHQEIQ